MADLKVKFLGLTFANPLVMPSGIIQEIGDHVRAEKAGAGGVTTKSLTKEPREGNPLPRVIKYPFGLLNSVGLRNPGIKEGVKQLKEFVAQSKIPVIASVFSANVPDFVSLTEQVVTAKPDFIELNLSCPNTTDELGESLGMGAESTEKSVAAVRQAVGKKIKLIAKLSPNVANIDQVAKAASDAGADAISAINTVGPGMVIDIATKKPRLGNKKGGVSGPGIKPVAVRCVYDIYKAVKIPIIGMGGVETVLDVVEMMLAGATLVGVGSATYRHGFGVYQKINQGLEKYLEENKIKSLAELVGGAHE
ncbi:MAG: Dihydroorotate dehydrogenase [Candidatus Beckwithbacteria bacterium GW2011_GWB1_47_15]|uniref:Dihydroorotate dehydrogenase n=1 Tax=Candidatus Beckwithbacteria bacterium GW2011_GWB1_47_15 TaxID=1618371 RepID=A0A0G1UUS3_9BACT|nr:MAG: dihydroorotate dehydrogenase 1B, dihydroorotate dehydrogenase (fumarate) [Candidatus Beckwithbacteria bacterium GW2011_GWC1_49_16]KKU35370.1 MAG: Dihydroorotate dehydrogenase [Candidatus Beckwithbacteria bacterium GW2011_GWA1_46_30]KKU61465.1 MAG: Dihydroorotate dehydrogenase [Candidatus Beckwithbacteria bacterium GW2011_GWB1_47_15]KKU71872.1 MAG: Dihydroorotate dehydrogenase [Candidatus Beckwithbacteria bacterium GW2011_GWA2_47_25]KKW03767.1 MAG: Dihydroorotate dehydrogenase [Candidatu